MDRRIGEARLEREGLSKEDAMLKRIVKERVRRSSKRMKFSLDEEGGMGELTHGVSLFAMYWVYLGFNNVFDFQNR